MFKAPSELNDEPIEGVELWLVMWRRSAIHTKREFLTCIADEGPRVGSRILRTLAQAPRRCYQTSMFVLKDCPGGVTDRHFRRPPRNRPIVAQEIVLFTSSYFHFGDC